MKSFKRAASLALALLLFSVGALSGCEDASDEPSATTTATTTEAATTTAATTDTTNLEKGKEDMEMLCEKYLLEQIKILQPKVIVLCGATSARSFLGNKIKISQIRGQWYKILDNIDATVIFHPSFLLRKHSEDEGSPRWLTKQDLKKIKEFISF